MPFDINGAMPVIWLALIVFFSVGEAATAGITSIWFAGGSVVALIASLLGAHIFIQILLFIVVSALLLAFTRPLVKNYITSKKEKTNADRSIGQIGIVTAPINNFESRGEVYVDGKYWTAHSDGDLEIPGNTRVRILRIEGVKLIVAPAEEPASVGK